MVAAIAIARHLLPMMRLMDAVLTLESKLPPLPLACLLPAACLECLTVPALGPWPRALWHSEETARPLREMTVSLQTNGATFKNLIRHHF